MKQPLSYCVIPAAVKKKLTMAKKNRQTVYLYGPAGFGKTLVVRAVSYTHLRAHET